jgi:hypothetical protein
MRVFHSMHRIAAECDGRIASCLHHHAPTLAWHGGRDKGAEWVCRVTDRRTTADRPRGMRRRSSGRSAPLDGMAHLARTQPPTININIVIARVRRACTSRDNAVVTSVPSRRCGPRRKKQVLVVGNLTGTRGTFAGSTSCSQASGCDIQQRALDAREGSFR